MSPDAKTGVTLGVVALAAVAVALAFSKDPLNVAEAKDTPGGTEHAAQEIGMGDPREPLTTPVDSPKIVVSKEMRTLALYSHRVVVRSYRIGLGFEPVGDKVREGDGRTPEGEFTVCSRNRDSKYYLSLGLSYPNREDAARGLREALITRQEHDAIVGAIDRGERPPWDTVLGGEIFIHGNGASRDWTWGCIALEDEDMRELFEAVPVGTPVVIEP